MVLVTNRLDLDADLVAVAYRPNFRTLLGSILCTYGFPVSFRH